MAPNSLYPSFVKIDYHSPYATHVMTLPTKQWLATPSLGGAGAFETWAGATCDADAMISGLVTDLAPFFKATASFDLYTIYTMASPTATPDPVASKLLGVPGTNASTSWEKAVQTSFTFRTDLFGIAKLVFLDAPSSNNFDKILSFAASPEALTILNDLNELNAGWAGRDGGRITVMSQIAYTLNEKLRREYGMN